MNKQITDKTMCLLTMDGIEIWITKEQTEKINKIVQDKNNRFIKIGDERINSHSISGIYTGERIRHLRRIKQGWWQCEACGRWHPRGEQCGCQGGKF
jgi:hypothetical protein